jgi:hypothetical protein
MAKNDELDALFTEESSESYFFAGPRFNFCECRIYFGSGLTCESSVVS